MPDVYLLAATVLLANLGLALIRLYRGPGAADRIMVAQLFGTTTVGVLLLLAESLTLAALRDVALVFILLAAPGIVAFIRLPALADREQRP